MKGVRLRLEKRETKRKDTHLFYQTILGITEWINEILDDKPGNRMAFVGFLFQI